MITDRKQKQVEELAALIHKAIVGGDDPSTCDRTAGPCWAAARAMVAQGWVSPEQHAAEVERLTKSVGAFSTARDRAKAGWERANDKVARVEALAEWLTSRPTILTTRGAAAGQIRAALTEPQPSERDHVAAADALRKQRQG